MVNDNLEIVSKQNLVVNTKFDSIDRLSLSKKVHKIHNKIYYKIHNKYIINRENLQS